MNKSRMRVSIVIPVYNEESHVRACLQAIARQTVRPFEVIVVDNNSTDATASIARSFPFVTLIKQERQGVVYARDAGFDAACGDIIGRIDADTLIAKDWVANVQQLFATSDVSAASGKIYYYDVPFASLFNVVDVAIRRIYARLLGRELALQGANMAVRRSVWLQIRGSVCRRAGIHEDFDLAVHINRQCSPVIFSEVLVAGIGFRLFEAPLRQIMAYAALTPRTYKIHGVKHYCWMYPVMWLVIVLCVPLRFLHKGYDPATGRFSLVQALSASTRARVNPATYVE